MRGVPSSALLRCAWEAAGRERQGKAQACPITSTPPPNSPIPLCSLDSLLLAFCCTPRLEKQPVRCLAPSSALCAAAATANAGLLPSSPPRTPSTNLRAYVRLQAHQQQQQLRVPLLPGCSGSGGTVPPESMLIMVRRQQKMLLQSEGATLSHQAAAEGCFPCLLCCDLGGVTFKQNSQSRPRHATKSYDYVRIHHKHTSCLCEQPKKTKPRSGYSTTNSARFLAWKPYRDTSSVCSSCPSTLPGPYTDCRAKKMFLPALVRHGRKANSKLAAALQQQSQRGIAQAMRAVRVPASLHQPTHPHIQIPSDPPPTLPLPTHAG